MIQWRPPEDIEILFFEDLMKLGAKCSILLRSFVPRRYTFAQGCSYFEQSLGLFKVSKMPVPERSSSGTDKMQSMKLSCGTFNLELELFCKDAS